MNKEKPEVQKSKEKSGEVIEGSQGRVEYPKRFGKTREFFKSILEKFKGNKEEESYWKEVEMDLDCSNNVAAMQKMETSNILNEDMDAWRNAIFEISKESKTESYFLNADETGNALYEEFVQRQSEVGTALDKNPEDYNKQDINDWNKDVLRWQDAANEVSTHGHSKNAQVLLEEAIRDKVEYEYNLHLAIKEAAKSKDINFESINKLREAITANSKKLSVYRRMRDSLYAIELNDKK